jgi:hypothetical protein
MIAARIEHLIEAGIDGRDVEQLGLRNMQASGPRGEPLRAFLLADARAVVGPKERLDDDHRATAARCGRCSVQ